MYNSEIAKAIRWHRENLGYNSKQVAVYLGIHLSTYSKIESEKRIINVSEFKIIAEYFNMSMDELSIIPNKSRK